MKCGDGEEVGEFVEADALGFRAGGKSLRVTALLRSRHRQEAMSRLQFGEYLRTLPVDVAVGRCGGAMPKLLLDLLTRVRALEDTQRQVLAGVDALGVQMAASATTHGRELHALRQDVVGDRKALAGLNMFNTVVQKLDPFRQMRAGLDEQKDERMCAQLDGLIASLEQLLRSSGFTPFHAAAGERFDPARMECVGYEQGEPDVVLAQVRCGYEAGTTLARPVGVLIAPPQAPSHEESTEQSVDQPEGEES